MLDCIFQGVCMVFFLFQKRGARRFSKPGRERGVCPAARRRQPSEGESERPAPPRIGFQPTAESLLAALRTVLGFAFLQRPRCPCAKWWFSPASHSVIKFRGSVSFSGYSLTGQMW